MTNISLAISIGNVSFLQRYNLKPGQTNSNWSGPGFCFWFNFCEWQAFCSLSPSLIRRVAKRFRRHGDKAKFWSSKGHNVLFGCLFWTSLAMIVEEILHLQGFFQGALGLDNSVRYRCNSPHLYLTEEHSIRWKFCLANQKLFHLIWSASENQSVRTHRRRNHYPS